MDERGANIDILFRNGLKDYEVLPPPEVWNNISPNIRRKQAPLLILRAAAMIAVIISMSFLAYRFSMELSSGLANNNLIQDPESEAPAYVSAGTEIIVPSQVSAFQSHAYSGSIETDTTNFKPAGTTELLAENNLESAATELVSVIYNPKKQKQDLMLLSRPVIASTPVETSTPEYSAMVPAETVTERWSISALASPTYFSSFNSENNAVTANLRSGEQQLFSYAGGLSLSYKVNRRLSVQSGLYYSSFGHQLAGISSFGGFQQYVYSKSSHNFEVLTTSGTIYTSNNDVYLNDNISSDRIISRYNNDVFDPAKANLQYLNNSLSQNFSYLEVPVFLKYKLVDKAIDFNLIGGLSSNLLVNNAVYTTTGSGRYQVGKTEGLNVITFSSSFGMGMEYSFTNNLSLNLEPTFRYYLNPFSQLSGMKIHPYSFGIFSGLSYKF